MNLYYTNVTGYNNEQPNPERSLGGYKSMTLVVNDDYSNLFDELSVMTMKNGRDEYRAIILRNDFDSPVAKVKISLTKPEDSICSYKMAIAELNGVNKYGQRFMENVATINNKPYHANFIDMGTEDAILEIGKMAAGEEVGLWICRHVDMEAAKEQYNVVCVKDPTDTSGRRWIPVTHKTEELIDINIMWL